MNLQDLTPEQLAALKILLGSQTGEEVLPQTTEEKLRELLKVELALGPARIKKALSYFKRITGLWVSGRGKAYDGPRVIVTGTLGELEASWEAHLTHLIGKYKASGVVVRHHREAIAYYCKALDIDFTPEVKPFEKRALAARALRSEVIILPEDFVALAGSIVNDVVYHKDVAYNEMFRHRARLNFFTGPRVPSEDSALLLPHVRVSEGLVIYYQTKIAGVEDEIITVPREVYGLGPHVLGWDARRSYVSWITKWRPKLIAKARYRGLLGEREDHAYVWVDIDGMPTDPERFRQDFGRCAKTVWPDFHPYKGRELAFIMHYLELIQEKGHADPEELLQWTGHVKYDTFRGYIQAAKKILRRVRRGSELNALLYEWHQI